MMRRRPLLRMAAVGGVAYMGAKAGTNKAMAAQSAGTGQPDPAAPAAAPVPVTPASAPEARASDASDRISQLQQLAALHTSGALTDEEFASEKAKVLG